MKRISNEVKVGAVALLTILAFIYTYNFLKGKEYFKRTNYYYTVYDKVGGLEESSPVEVNGYKVGIVQDVRFIDATSGKLLVIFSVARNFRIPVNTVAEIVPVSLLGGMKVQFVYGEGPGFYEEGDTIPGRLAPSITDKVETELIPVRDKIASLTVILDSVINSVDKLMDDKFREDLSGTISNLNSTTGSINRIVSSKEKDLRSTIENINNFSEMLARNSGRMSNTFEHLETITDTLAAADIYNSVMNLRKSLEKASEMIDNLNDGKGTAGQLLTNDSIYINLNNSLSSLNELLTDMRENPKRYVHFSVFGKKNSSPK
jgi:phospholipid/cholesterol/gamma-HCH transport system substrate-binding protein